MRERPRTLLLCSLLVVALTSGGRSEAAPTDTPTGPSLPPKASAASQNTPKSAPGDPAVTLGRIREQLAARRRRLAQIAEQERRVLAQLSWTRERLAHSEARLSQSTSDLRGTRRAVAQAMESLELVSQRLSAHEALMNARLRSLYEQGPLGYLDVLFGAANFRDFVMRSYLVGRIIQHDLRIFHEVAEERRQKDEVRTDLELQQDQLAMEQRHWIATRQERARLAAEHERLLKHVRAERRAQEEAIRELEAESVRIAEIIRRAAPGGVRGPARTLRNGSLLWPVVGAITSGYGWRIHPIFHSREFHTGIDIAASWGTPVHAAVDGTVIFTGWMKGYGMLVILDHANGLSTTYSHLSSYAVQVGDRVRQAEMIGRIGSTGWSTGPHLFFEVREDGRPVDPLGP